MSTVVVVLLLWGGGLITVWPHLFCTLIIEIYWWRMENLELALSSIAFSWWYILKRVWHRIDVMIVVLLASKNERKTKRQMREGGRQWEQNMKVSVSWHCYNTFLEVSFPLPFSFRHSALFSAAASVANGEVSTSLLIPRAPVTLRVLQTFQFVIRSSYGWLWRCTCCHSRSRVTKGSATRKTSWFYGADVVVFIELNP